MKQLNQEQKRLAVLVGILVVAAVFWIVTQFGGTGVESGRVTEELLDWAPNRLPELRIAADSDATDLIEDGRNPFVFGQPPTPTPNLTPRVVPTPRPTQQPTIRPTATPRPPGWRPTPAFTREYIGHFGPDFKRVAVFRQASPEGFAEIDVAPMGGTLPNAQGDATFIVRSIDLESVVIGYVGFSDKESTRVPLSTK
jgi:hypothetical protein